METEMPVFHKQILSLIGQGKENARTVSYISKLVGLSSTAVREIVSELVVKYGYGIGTSNTKHACGYYFITNDDEKRETVRNLRSRAMKILKRANVISALPLGGQEDFNFLIATGESTQEKVQRKSS
ncbi:hypothetical protein [Cytobacillus oceanisediminis]|uniref:hypothetical protein n=1 Tax=Cytobacillus oceanisediminis TaxID=665099 RepID=UPI00203C620E|nr:hypothetical protein [Cytobacillus oceanisediminis]MCM3405927.1 hypothetical protein [Cytobacillus oceanisediminis]